MHSIKLKKATEIEEADFNLSARALETEEREHYLYSHEI